MRGLRGSTDKMSELAVKPEAKRVHFVEMAMMSIVAHFRYQEWDASHSSSDPMEELDQVEFNFSSIFLFIRMTWLVFIRF